MSAIIFKDMKGRELPDAWQKQAKLIPDEDYVITVQKKSEYRSLEEIMEQISENAQGRGMTPEILSEILGEDISHIL